MDNSQIKKNKKPKRIGIDARFYGPLGKGLGRYVQEILDRVTEIDKENEYVIFLNKHNFDEFPDKGPRVKKVVTNIRWYTVAEQLFFPFIIAKERVDMMHFPHFNVPVLSPVKFTVTIHDLILTKFPTPRASTLSPFFYRLKDLFYKLVIKTAVSRAKRVIAVSEFTKKDIVEQFGTRPDKIEVTLEGVADLKKGRDIRFFSKIDDKNTLLSYNIKGSFLLYVGNAYPHKNLETLLKVFYELHRKRPKLRLVLVGKEDYFYKRIKLIAQELGLWKPEDKNTPVLFPGYVPDRSLEVLYKRAEAYIFPSLYEGFGLPPLEAMARRCPVISSNSSSMPEILGEAALYFDPKDKKDMLSKIGSMIDNKDLKDSYIKKGEQKVKKYDWQDTADKTLDIYKKVLANGPSK